MVTASATNVIDNQDTLQAGATFYVSSGTVAGYFSAGGKSSTLKSTESIGRSVPSDQME